MKKEDKFSIISVKKGVTERGANYFEIEAVNNETGEMQTCVYFGNTTPKRLIDIKTSVGSNGNIYYIGIIQPHTSRDKKTGRFIKGVRRSMA